MYESWLLGSKIMESGSSSSKIPNMPYERVTRRLEMSEVIIGDGPRKAKNRNLNASGHNEVPLKRLRKKRVAEVIDLETVEIPEGGEYDLNDPPYEDEVEVEVEAKDVDHDDLVSVHIFKDKRGRYSRGKSGGEKGARADDDRSWVVTEPILGGPRDDSVIPSFLGHVASKMWQGHIRGVLRLENRVSVNEQLRNMYNDAGNDVQTMINNTGLFHLPSIMFDHLDIPLICAFVERWQPDTNSFHMPFGEMTIMLHDVWEILRIPVEGQPVMGSSSREDLLSLYQDLFGCDRLTVTKNHWNRGGIRFKSLMSRFHETTDVETKAKVWILIMLGSTLFVDKNGNTVRAGFIKELVGGLTGVAKYSWASATLANLYHQLGCASRGDCKSMVGCLAIVQTWIYEHFPSFSTQGEPMLTDDAPRASLWHPGQPGNTDQRLASFRTRIDRLQAHEVSWMPYGAGDIDESLRPTYSGWVQCRTIIEPYLPGRACRQIGYIQDIPALIPRPVHAVRAWNALLYTVQFEPAAALYAWESYPHASGLLIGRMQKCQDLAYAWTPNYMEWYLEVSRPRLLPVDDGNDFEMDPPPRSSTTDYWVDQVVDMWRETLHLVDPERSQPMTDKFNDFQTRWRSSH